MRDDGAELLGVAPREVSREANLLACGLDYMRVMELASRWRRHGVEMRSADMLAAPRLMPGRGSYVRRRRVLGAGR
jgi:aryl carrier-like protein